MQGVGTGRLIASRYALRQRRAALGPIEVWAATDSTLGREVSVTVLPSSDPKATPLLEAARSTVSVNDHRLVRVLDVGSRGEIAWVVEESLTESTSVTDLLTSGSLPPEEARRIAGEVASALDVASQSGLHHLHITPHAVRRTKAGLVKIAGLATAAAVEGTEIPDDAEGQRIDAQAVVALLYTCMTGMWPLRTGVAGVESAPRVAGNVVPASELTVGIPDDLDDLCVDTFNGGAAPRTPAEVAVRLGSWSHTLVRSVAPRSALAAGETEQIPRVRTRTAAAALPAALPARRPSHREQRAHNRAAQAAEERRAIAARRRDPGFLDVPKALESSEGPLEPPAPLVAAPIEREGRYAKYVLGAVGAGLLIASALALTSLMSAVDEVSNQRPAAHPTATSGAATDTPGAGERSGSAADATPSTEAGDITFDRARALDPRGDGNENGGSVDRTHDGDPTTAWQSEGYKQADYQGVKPGVGVALTLPQGAEPSSISVALADAPQDGTVYLSSSRSIEGATEIRSFTDATGVQDMTVPEEARQGARYVIVWITKAAQQPDGKYRAVVSEVTARS